MILVSGALLGFIAVAFGAFYKHALRGSVADEQSRFLMTALKYNQVHAVVITAIGLMLVNVGKLSQILTLRWSGLLFVIGTILFSFSIYVFVNLNLPNLLTTPIGGLTIIGPWLFLLASGVMAKCKL